MKKAYYTTDLKDISYKNSIFLAGPTVRSHQKHLTSWRKSAIKLFEEENFDGTLIIPEFEDGRHAILEGNEIIEWEYKNLVNCSCIMFWIPRTPELIGLTTNWEHGYWTALYPHKMVYGRPDDAYKIQYLDTMWKKVCPQIPIHNTLTDTVNAATIKAK